MLLLAPFVAQPQSATALVEQFERQTVFWQQFGLAKRIVELQDTRVLPKLEHWLTDEDRHLRGNAAFIFASLSDDRGVEVLRATLSDRSSNRAHTPGGIAPSMGPYAPPGWWIPGQIIEDRYYAVHLFGELKDARVAQVFDMEAQIDARAFRPPIHGLRLGCVALPRNGTFCIGATRNHSIY